MKKSIIAIFLLLWGGIAYCPIYQELILPVDTPICPLIRLSIASAWVESSNNQNALNRSEMAFGLYSIRAIRLKDYYLKTGKHYTLKEMYDPNKSKEVWFYYANQFYPTDIESITRCWNGGDRGMKKRSTKKYYQKVLKMMENIK